MVSNGAQRAFALEIIFNVGKSVIATQRAFRAHFMLSRNNAVPDRKSMLLWEENFRNTGSSIKSKPSRIIKGWFLPKNDRNIARHCNIIKDGN